MLKLWCKWGILSLWRTALDRVQWFIFKSWMINYKPHFSARTTTKISPRVRDLGVSITKGEILWPWLCTTEQFCLSKQLSDCGTKYEISTPTDINWRSRDYHVIEDKVRLVITSCYCRCPQRHFQKSSESLTRLIENLGIFSFEKVVSIGHLV